MSYTKTSIKQKDFKPRSEWNSITGIRGGPLPNRDEDNPTNNQDGLIGGRSRPEKVQAPRAARHSTEYFTRNSAKHFTGQPTKHSERQRTMVPS